MSGSDSITSFGRYSIVRKLATGGMAEVFLARAQGPLGFEKTLVIKCLLPELARDSTFVQMFLAEAKIAAGLHHPNVAQIFDFGELDGQYFIAMEYIDGPNLRAIKRRASHLDVQLPPELCAKIISIACEGLHYVHEHCDPVSGRPLELVHRDVSADNLMLARNGTLKVLDFGIMRSTNSESYTRSGAVRGKLAYMSPEQVSAEPLDRRTDVWALGMVLYELLSGHRPFEATQDAAVMKAILFERFTPVRQLRPDAPAALEVVLDRCFQKSRHSRYSSCRELQVELEQYLRSGMHEVGSYELAAMIQALDQGRPPTVGRSTVPMPALQVQQALAANAETVRARPVNPRPSQPPRPPSVSIEVTTAPHEPPLPTDVVLTPRGRRARIAFAAAGLFVAGVSGAAMGILKASHDNAPPTVAAAPTPPQPVAPPPVAAPAPPVPPEPTPEPQPLPPSEPVAAAVRAPAAKRPKAVAAPTPAKNAESQSWPVELRALPEAEVTVDGKATPLRTQVKLAEGSHRARFVNSELGAADVTFEVKPCLNIVGYNLTTRQLSQQCRPVGP